MENMATLYKIKIIIPPVSNVGGKSMFLFNSFWRHDRHSILSILILGFHSQVFKLVHVLAIYFQVVCNFGLTYLKNNVMQWVSYN